MAREISAGRFSQLARALFDVGQSRPFELEDNLRAVVVLEGDRPENSFAKDERLLGTLGISQPAVAAQLSFSGWVNPPDSRIVAVITFVRNASANPADLIVGVIGAPTGLITGELQRSPVVAPRDSRLFKVGSFNCALNNVRGASVPGVGFVAHDSLPAGAITEPDYFVVLGPGGFLVLQTQALNLVMSGNVKGYERALQQGVRA